jgi:glutamyl-tRNA synthetase
LADLKSLGIHGDALTWTSDHFDLIYNYALEMIKKGKAYVDDTPLEEMRHERMEGLASKNRDLSVEENLHRFDEMKNATEFVCNLPIAQCT